MKSIATSIVAGSLLAMLAVAQTPRYTVTDLGPVGGPPGQPFVIKNNGLVSGAAAIPGGAMHAVLWSRGLKIDLGTPGLGGANSVAFGVNERGQVVGQAETSTADPKGEDFCGFKSVGLPSSGNTCLPFLWQNGVMTPLTTLGGNNGVANQINNRGEAAGSAENAAQDLTCPAPQVFQFKPVIWEQGRIHELPTYGDPDGIAFSINDNGQVAGASGTCTTFNVNGDLTYLYGLHALLWQNGTPIDLGNLGGTAPGGGNVALTVNNQGQVVGVSGLSGNATFHGFLWTKESGIQDLGTVPPDVASVALGINDGGEVVGISFDPNFNPRAFVRQHGVMTDLNTLIPAGSPLYLLDACSINSRGEIIGLAVTSTGEAHGYLATPSYGASPLR